MVDTVCEPNYLNPGENHMAQNAATFTQHHQPEEVAVSATYATGEKDTSLAGSYLVAFIGLPVVVFSAYLALFAPF